MASLAPLNKIERAHQMYRDGLYQEALGFYTEALSMAKTKAQKIALHSNRAACYLKLHNFKQAAEECTSVLELDHKHTGALMLRAQTLVTLKEYHSALFDVNRLMDLNPSSEVYRNLQARLRTQLSLAPIPESEAELEEEEEVKTEAEPNINKEEDKQDKGITVLGMYQKVELNRNTINAEVTAPMSNSIKESSEQGRDKKSEPIVAPRTKSIKESSEQGEKKSDPKRTIPAGEVIAPQAPHTKESSEQHSKGWQAIPKPKGHSTLDYARWDRVEDDSSEEDDDDEEESQPHCRFRVRSVGVRPVR